MIKLKNILLEKKDLDASLVKHIGILTNRNAHTEARMEICKWMKWKQGIKFYNAMMDINDVFGGYNTAASKLNEMMEGQLYKQMYRTWSNYDEIYGKL